MKYLSFFLLLVLVLVSYAAGKPASTDEVSESVVTTGLQANLLKGVSNEDHEADFRKADSRLAEISAEMRRANVLKADILRGWYLGGRHEKKYGTPDTWIFVESGAESKWMSPNLLDEESLADDRKLCRQTAGTYVTSCLDTSDSDCEYVGESHCACLSGSQWVSQQGCILVSERGTYVSVNNADLYKGWYFGLPNEKKLNTPSDWEWFEKGRESVWLRSAPQTFQP